MSSILRHLHELAKEQERLLFFTLTAFVNGFASVWRLSSKLLLCMVFFMTLGAFYGLLTGQLKSIHT